jgi:hypothetical protein
MVNMCRNVCLDVNPWYLCIIVFLDVLIQGFNENVWLSLMI